MRGGYGGGSSSESQATPHPLFSHTLNGVERGGLSIMQFLSIRDCRILLPEVVYIALKCSLARVQFSQDHHLSVLPL